VDDDHQNRFGNRKTKLFLRTNLQRNQKIEDLFSEKERVEIVSLLTPQSSRIEVMVSDLSERSMFIVIFGDFLESLFVGRIHIVHK